MVSLFRSNLIQKVMKLVGLDYPDTLEMDGSVSLFSFSGGSMVSGADMFDDD